MSAISDERVTEFVQFLEKRITKQKQERAGSTNLRVRDLLETEIAEAEYIFANFKKIFRFEK